MPDIITRALFESKGIPTRDIVAAIWGRKLSGGYEPAEATGTLPLTFRSDGSALIDYRIYGNTVETTVKTANLVPLTTQKTATADGITVTIDSSGVWHVTGTALQDVNILFDLEEAFTVPTALDYGGEGVIQFFNSVAMDDGSGNETARVLFYYGNVQRDYFGLHIQNRSITQYSDLANKGVNRLGVWVKQGITCDFTLAPMVVDDGIVHDEYILPETTEVQGVGVRTENMFDKSKVEQNCCYNQVDDKINNAFHNESDYIPVKAGKTYTLYLKRLVIGYTTFINLYDASRAFYENVRRLPHADGYYTFTPDVDGYVRFNETPQYATDYMLYEGEQGIPYEPYGYKLPMVSRTENLLDQDANGWERNKCVNVNGQSTGHRHFDASPYIKILPEKVYTLVDLNGGNSAWNAFYDADKNFISAFSATGQKPHTATSPSNAKYIRCSVLALNLYPDAARRAMLIEGSTAPDSYIPYHRAEIPIYIGNTQLMQDEYVSYGKQKVYKRTEQLYNSDAPDVEQHCYYNQNGVKVNSEWHDESGFIPVIADAYILRIDIQSSGFGCFVNFYDSNKNFVSNLATLTNPIGTYSITVPQDGYVRFNTVPSRARYTFVNGATAPQTYIPYLTPTDPPVPLPELPTFSDANTVLDYEETPAPEKVWVKYQKGD